MSDSMNLEQLRRDMLDAYSGIHSADKHWLIANINGLDMFLFNGSFCLTGAEMGQGAEERLYRTMQRHGIAAHTGRFKHYSSVYGVPESLDEQRCVILRMGRSDVDIGSERFAALGRALSNYFNVARYRPV